MIFITGATGNVGAPIVQLLAERNLPVRAALSSSDGNSPFPANVETVPFRFGQPETYAPAFTGVKKLFLMRPPAISDVKTYLFPAIDAAIEVGVEHIVFLSLLGIDRTPFVPHYHVEEYLKASEIDYTFLRPSFFMQNLNTTHRAEIRQQDELIVPVGRGKLSWIDTRDIAQVAVTVLTQPAHDNQIYQLTGPESLDYEQVAARLSTALGRKIEYNHPSILRFIRYQRQLGTPLPFILVMVGLYTASRFGASAHITDTFQRLTGRPPRSIDEYIRDHTACWQ
ncbi:MAG: SDR family oxidoreductase [Anaerolineaceae bacterium]|nr:SDR family oxidoreductase [Anaerolineaceae bacterium]